MFVYVSCLLGPLPAGRQDTHNSRTRHDLSDLCIVDDLVPPTCRSKVVRDSWKCRGFQIDPTQERCSHVCIRFVRIVHPAARAAAVDVDHATSGVELS